MFNEHQNKYLTLALQQRGIDDIRYVQKFLVLNKNLELSNAVSGKQYDFKVPGNYFDIADVSSVYGGNGVCSGEKISVYELQPENVTTWYDDEYIKPSFEYREALYTINSDNVSILTDDFKIEKVAINYYRYPNQIEIVDSNNPESKFNETIPIEWDDKALDEIISLMAFGFDLNESNPRAQGQLTRAQK